MKKEESKTKQGWYIGNFKKQPICSQIFRFTTVPVKTSPAEKKSSK